ncbi:MAG: amidase [Burkholderiales bacterium]|nr:amidase [Burkholderiales bacterium]MDE2501929.1 amidase [Burkholderiales bacterium]
MTAALHELGIAALARAYAARDCSPVDVVRAVFERMARCEPRLHATWAADAEAALAAARASESRWLRGAALGPLDGVPVTVKENIATRGLPLPLGTAATELVPAADDAPPAARLREAGAVLVAKTTMPDYGMLSSGLSSFHALTRNPWDPTKNPGGSSAGAAAAAAAGYGPLHLGTDIGGSIRLPADWCGVVGFKPSNGRVPIRPPYVGRVAGPITRSTDDAAIAMSVLSLPDARDATSLPPQALDWCALGGDPREPGELLRGLRIGLLLDAGWGLACDAEIAAAVRDAARRLEAAGAHVEPLAPFTTRAMADGINLFWRMRSWLDISALPPARRERVLPYIRDWVAAGAHFSAAEVFGGYSQIAALRDAAVAACAPFDFVISPVAPVSAFAADWASPTNDPLRAMEHIAYTLPYNMSEQPAISVPCAQGATGLPIGLQIAGRRHDDLGVLRVARAFEQLRAPLPPWPQS